MLNRAIGKHRFISTDGPFHNVLKIKPPICFDKNNANQLLTLLDQILAEDFSQV